MILYLDTSALVKVYIDEDYSETVRTSVSNADLTAISRIGYVEFFSSLTRMLREGVLNESKLFSIRANFNSNWQNFYVVDVTNTITIRASELLFSNPLRASDSIHLASVDMLCKNISDEVKFGCFDKRLTEGAQSIGIDLEFNV